MPRVLGSRGRSAGSTTQPGDGDRRSVRVTITNQPAGSDSAVAVVAGTNSTCQLVEYATPVVRDLVNSLQEGAVVAVDLERVHGRGNCWRVLGVHTVAEKGSGRANES